jgi:diacylglycerol kinase family enzyme
VKTATLIVNPAAGNARLFASRLPAIEATLKAAGYEPRVEYTEASADSAKNAAMQAAKTSELVIACGGDGTVNGVMQGLATSRVALGVLPLGTANALARNLGLPMDPLAALERLLTYTPTRIPLGEIETATERRYFVVMAGCGPDGALVHSLSAREKSRFGRQAYYAHAARLFVMRRWPAFAVEYTVKGQRTSARAVGLMASRVPDLGGAFSGLTARASLMTSQLHVQLLRAPAMLSFPAWFGLSRARLPNPWLTTVNVDEVRCSPIGTRTVYAQADAEPMGALPITLRVVPDALTLLMPR